MTLLESQSLKDLNWWKVGGFAEYFCQPENMEDLKEALEIAKVKNLKINILSGGSNVLISEGKISGLTIHLKKFSHLDISEVDGFIHLSCLAGTPKSELAKVFLQKKLAPAVFLTGIPGDVGGGVVMNAGVGEDRVPREFCEIVDWVEVLSTEEASYAQLKRFEANDLHWEYRHSSGWQPGIIARVGIKWKNDPDTQVMAQVREANKKRVNTQPLNQPSCGSVFRNPTGLKSAKLIQDCGLKSFSIGGAQVSEKHANFIINKGDAKADDIFQLIQTVQKTVKEKAGVDLHREVVLFGEWNLNS